VPRGAAARAEEEATTQSRQGSRRRQYWGRCRRQRSRQRRGWAWSATDGRGCSGMGRQRGPAGGNRGQRERCTAAACAADGGGEKHYADAPLHAAIGGKGAEGGRERKDVERGAAPGG
jgi:hypothetical protein